jgi:Zn-dependent protease
MDPFSITIFIFILLFSVIFHEVAHGIMAERLGDPTARDAGRLTLNPIPHIDLFGSILLPAMLWFATSGAFVIGAAKPVPVDYRYFKNFRRDMFLVSIAGVVTNFLLAVMAALVLRFVPNVSAVGQQLLLQTVILNLALAIFNSLPIPPLDGSKMLASIFGFFNESWMYRMLEMERFGFLIVILFLITGILDKILIPAILFLAGILLG